MAGQGWLGLVFPEKYGGMGMDFLDLAVLLEEMGRACLPGPYFSTVVLGGLTLLEAGSEEQKAKLIPQIAAGEKILTLALTEPSASYTQEGIETEARADGDDYVISGNKLFVPDAHVADYMVCAARTGDRITLFLVDTATPGISTTILKTIASDKLCEVAFDRVRVPKANVLGEVGGGWVLVENILQRAAAAKCAEMVGGAQQVLEM
ncbi:MAG: acyl-CoA dehydrogenase family protein, partial [Dehalococcoidia bacterium]|nr:acyl-CoA dehydrogenase family protein [Dehalococcoidia bacterium]